MVLTRGIARSEGHEMKKTGKTKTKVKPAHKGTRKTASKGKAKRAAKRSYDQQMGRPTGRGAGALKRLERRTEELIAEGVPATTARQQALSEMRANPKKDWRRG
jgi:hypothetical protein